MDELMRALVDGWKQVRQYRDVEAVEWHPGDAMAEKCHDGCTLLNTGWQSMADGFQAVDGYRLTRFCREHGFARIYFISGPSAAEHGWSPHS